MADDFTSFVQSIGTLAQAGSDIVTVIQKVQDLMNSGSGASQHDPQHAPPSVRMLPFAASQPHVDNGQSMASFSTFGAQHGTPSPVPAPAPIGGIDLSGLWIAPGPQGVDSAYLRQFGPYLNVVFGLNQVPTGVGEGAFNPANGTLLVTGQFPQMGLRCEWVAQVQPNWTIVGQATFYNSFGMLQAQSLVGYTRVTSG